MALAARSDLVVIEVTGDDRLAYLDSVTSQRLADLAPGTVTGVLVLDAKGAPLAMAWAAVADEQVTLLAPPAAADHLLEVVARRTFLSQATFTRREVVVTSAAGDDLDEALAAAGWATEADSWRAMGDVVVVRHAHGAELVGVGLDELVAAGFSMADLDDLRIVSGQPRFGHEVVAGRLPEEYGLLPTHVHLSKGCYPGQESIAHMWMLGRPRRRLAVVAVEPDADAAADNGADIALTGVADGHGLGFVRPDVAPGTQVAPGIVVTDLVGDDRPVVGWTPSQTRHRDREERPDLLPRRRA